MGLGTESLHPDLPCRPTIVTSGEQLGNPVESTTTPSVPPGNPDAVTKPLLALSKADHEEHVASVTLVTGAHAVMCDNVTTRIWEADDAADQDRAEGSDP